MTNLKNQNGAALAVGLILLLIITLMGYTGMKGTILQEKMAAGLHNRSLSNSGANSAVRAGEYFLYNLVQDTNGVGVSGTPNGDFFNIYSQYQEAGDPSTGINTNVDEFMENDWTSSVGTDHGYGFNASTVVKNAKLAEEPRYMIQELLAKASNELNSSEFGGGRAVDSAQQSFLITGKSVSGDGNSYSLVQSLYTVVPSSTPSQ